MQTPIYDFLMNYNNNGTSRFHMPGHKGKGPLGFEALDLTEVKGADSLYEADGIIAKSEDNATKLFSSKRTFYSTEGSSQCIRAMLYLAINQCNSKSKPVIVAARNVHKAFIYAAALLDFEVKWVWPKHFDSLCQCDISADDIEEALNSLSEPAAAVYVTSPNYLGNILDIKSIADLCHQHGTILAVDNAHGSYLHFLEKSMHPLDLGADLVCDSAHKTLPVLTGGAYLHLNHSMSDSTLSATKLALALFGSTSPSYLTLASLDACNAYIDNGYPNKLAQIISNIQATKDSLRNQGWQLENSDPLRITICTPGNGIALSEVLRNHNMECEYAEDAFLVLMLTEQNTKEELDKLVKVLGKAPTSSLSAKELPLLQPECKASIRQALFAKSQSIPVSQALGRICAAPTVSCPPAIPILVSGEVVSEDALRVFQHYHIPEIEVVLE